jgi:hypothetical protein
VSVLVVLIVAGLLLVVTAPLYRRRRIVSQFDPGMLPGRRPDPRIARMDADKGLELGSGVFWRPESHPNPHVLIVGGSGSGKTCTLRLLAGDLLKKGYACVLLDFHGDLDIPGAVIHRIALDSEYGVNPLVVSNDPTGGGPDPQRF